MKTLIAFVLSLAIMGVIFSRINLGEFVQYFTQIDPWLAAVAVLFFVPQVVLSAYRWQVMVKDKTRMSLWESVKLILSANALNILLPSRVGDLSKAYFVGRAGKIKMKRSMNVVFFEKYIDLASLGIVVLTGILWSRDWDESAFLGFGFSGATIGLFPVLYFINLHRWTSFPLFEKNRVLNKVKDFLVDSQEYLNELKRDFKLLGFVLGLSVFLWFVHIVQFYLIFLALHSQVSVFNVFRLVPLAILVGLIPVTVAGVGTRDSAMIYFFAPYESTALIVGVGLFASLRYFVPGILGLPFLNRYIVKKV